MISRRLCETGSWYRSSNRKTRPFNRDTALPTPKSVNSNRWRALFSKWTRNNQHLGSKNRSKHRRLSKFPPSSTPICRTRTKISRVKIADSNRRWYFLPERSILRSSILIFWKGRIRVWWWIWRRPQYLGRRSILSLITRGWWRCMRSSLRNLKMQRLWFLGSNRSSGSINKC